MIMKIPNEIAHRHSATLAIFKYFAYDHLNEPLKGVSKVLYNTAYEMIIALPDCPELTVGLRKLLEAKDCLVRTALSLPENPPNYPQWPQDAPELPVQSHPITNPDAKEGGFGSI